MNGNWLKELIAEKEKIANLGVSAASGSKAVARMQRDIIHICLTGFTKSILWGDLRAAKMFLRSAIKESGAYPVAAKELMAPEKSIVRMLGPKGNPQAKHLFAIVSWLAERWDVYPTVK